MTVELTEEQKAEHERSVFEANSDPPPIEDEINIMEMTVKDLNLNLDLDDDDDRDDTTGDRTGEGKNEDGFQSGSGTDEKDSWGLGAEHGNIFNTEESDTTSSGWGDNGVDTDGWIDDREPAMQTLRGPTDLKSLQEKYGSGSFRAPPPKRFVPDEKRLKAVQAMLAARDGKEGGKERRFRPLYDNPI